MTWQKVYEHDKNGITVFGSVNNLIIRLKAGQSLRVLVNETTGNSTIYNIELIRIVNNIVYGTTASHRQFIPSLGGPDGKPYPVLNGELVDESFVGVCSSGKYSFIRFEGSQIRTGQFTASAVWFCEE